MKFGISSSVLLKNLQMIYPVAGSNTKLAILENFLFDLKDKELHVTASDLETTMIVVIPVENVESEGRLAVPAKMLIETLKTLPDVPVVLDINQETNFVELFAGDGRYKFNGFNADEYPQSTIPADTQSIEIPTNVLSEAISKTVFATANDEIRPVMTGVLCQLRAENVTFVATDAHKLVRYRRTDIKSGEDNELIISKKSVNILKNVLGKDDTAIRVEYNYKNAFFTVNNIHVICRLIEGKYPNYEAVIPKENPNVLVFDRLMMINVLKRISVFASQSTHQVRFKIAGQELILSAEDMDYSNEAKERMSCSYNGVDMEIGFNSKFMIEMLSNIDTEEVKLAMSTSNRAGIMSPIGSDDDGADLLMLLMPVMLAN